MVKRGIARLFGLGGQAGVLRTGVELRALISDFMAFRSEIVRKERAG